jgi:hypothetical protein
MESVQLVLFQCVNALGVQSRLVANEPAPVVYDLTDMPVWSGLRAWLCREVQEVLRRCSHLDRLGGVVRVRDLPIVRLGLVVQVVPEREEQLLL